MYIQPLDQAVPWTTYNLCDQRYCFLKLTSQRKLSFNELLDFFSVTCNFVPGGTDIRNCITFEPTASKRFFSQLHSVNARASLLPQANVCTDIHVNQTFRYNFFDYKYSYFIFVTRGDFQNSATRVRVCLFIQKVFPLFSEPYVLLAPHPRTPFYEWKSPSKECFYAELDAYLTISAFNSNIHVICDHIGQDLVRRLPFLVCRCHIARQHTGPNLVNINLELNHSVNRNHKAIALKRRYNCNLAREVENSGNWIQSPTEIVPLVTNKFHYWSLVLALSYRTDYSI